jgi:hypothetical protein
MKSETQRMSPYRGKFIAYFRVSTDKQGKSGLGLEAQRKAVLDYLNGGRWELVQEFVEVESGKHNDEARDSDEQCLGNGEAQPMTRTFNECQSGHIAAVSSLIDAQSEVARPSGLVYQAQRGNTSMPGPSRRQLCHYARLRASCSGAHRK